MPTYRNVSGAMMHICGREVMPGEVVQTLLWDRTNKAIEKLDDMPMYNPTLLSMVIDEDIVLPVPLYDKLNGIVSRYLIHMFVAKGDVSIWYNSFENNPPLLLYEGARWNERCTERIINDIRIKFLGKQETQNKMWVIIERI